MKKTSTCREEILKSVHSLILEKEINEFSIKEVIEIMKKGNTHYAESTIRTHITSKLCKNAPDNHRVVYEDFERIEKGRYRLLEKL